jgi:hypothetical protein
VWDTFHIADAWNLINVKGQSDAVAISEAITRMIGRAMSEAAVIVEAIHNLVTPAQKLDAVTMSDVSLRLLTKGFVDAITVHEQPSFADQDAQLDGATIADAIHNLTTKPLAAETTAISTSGTVFLGNYTADPNYTTYFASDYVGIEETFA